jgi:hypothetical protein
MPCGAHETSTPCGVLPACAARPALATPCAAQLNLWDFAGAHTLRGKLSTLLDIHAELLAPYTELRMPPDKSAGPHEVGVGGSTEPCTPGRAGGLGTGWAGSGTRYCDRRLHRS